MPLLIPNWNSIPAVQGDCGKGDFGTPRLRFASGYIRRFASSLAFHLTHPLDTDLSGVVIRYLVVLASRSWLHSIFKPHLIGEGHSFTEQFCTGTACRTLFETANDSIWSPQINRLGWIEHHFNNMQNHSRDFQQISECCHFLVKWTSHYIRLSYMIIPITNLVEHQKTYFTTWPTTWSLHKFTIDSGSCETSSILSVCDPCKAPMTQLGWCQFQQSPRRHDYQGQRSVQRHWRPLTTVRTTDVTSCVHGPTTTSIHLRPTSSLQGHVDVFFDVKFHDFDYVIISWPCRLGEGGLPEPPVGARDSLANLDGDPAEGLKSQDGVLNLFRSFAIAGSFWFTYIFQRFHPLQSHDHK